MCQYLPCRSQALSELLNTQAEKGHKNPISGEIFDLSSATELCYLQQSVILFVFPTVMKNSYSSGAEKRLSVDDNSFGMAYSE